ncbi:MAG: hypothetical protein H0X33_14560 [Taibaiella sp.]|nr:hypothetical protein [Taibaiella sp.]
MKNAVIIFIILISCQAKAQVKFKRYETQLNGTAITIQRSTDNDLSRLMDKNSEQFILGTNLLILQSRLDMCMGAVKAHSPLPQLEDCNRALSAINKDIPSFDLTYYRKELSVYNDYQAMLDAPRLHQQQNIRDSIQMVSNFRAAKIASDNILLEQRLNAFHNTIDSCMKVDDQYDVAALLTKQDSINNQNFILTSPFDNNTVDAREGYSKIAYARVIIEKQRKLKQAQILEKQRTVGNDMFYKERIYTLTKKYGAKIAKRLADRQVWLGMTSAMCIDALGGADHIRTTYTKQGNVDTWYYDYQYGSLVFKKGVLIAINE